MDERIGMVARAEGLELELRLSRVNSKWRRREERAVRRSNRIRWCKDDSKAVAEFLLYVMAISLVAVCMLSYLLYIRPQMIQLHTPLWP